MTPFISELSAISRQLSVPPYPFSLLTFFSLILFSVYREEDDDSLFVHDFLCYSLGSSPLVKGGAKGDLSLWPWCCFILAERHYKTPGYLPFFSISISTTIRNLNVAAGWLGRKSGRGFYKYA